MDSAAQPGGAWSHVVGREALVDRLERTIAGQDRGVVLEGPAGIGKTTLLRTVLNRLDAGSQQSITASGDEATQRVRFGAFVHLFESVPARRADELYFFKQGVRSVDQLTERGPVFVVVDNAHLLDESSGSLLYQLAALDRVQVVAAVQDGAAAPPGVQALWRNQIVERIAVEPLTEAATEELAQAVLGCRPSRVLLDDVQRIAAGNPLLITELLRLGLDAGVIVCHDDVCSTRGTLVSSAIAANIVDARLARCSAADRRALEVLAVGDPLEIAVFEKATGTRALDSLERRGLIRGLVRQKRKLVTFAHPHHAAVVQASMTHGRHRQVCTTLVEALESTGGRRSVDPLRKSRWRLDAGLSVDPSEAAALAGAALAQFDIDLAERLATVAVEAHDAFDGYYQLGRALHLGGAGERAERALEAAQERAGDDVELAQAVIARMENLHEALGRPAAAGAVGRAALDRMSHQECRDEVAAQLAEYLIGARQVERAVATGATALRRDVDDRNAVRSNLAMARASFRLGRLDDARHQAEQALMHWPAVAVELPLAIHRLRYRLLVVDVFAGYLEGRMHAIGEALVDAERQRDVPARGILLFFTAWGRMFQGQIDPALAAAQAAVELTAIADPYRVGRVTQGLIGYAHTQANRVGAASEVLARLSKNDSNHRAVSIAERAHAWLVARRGDVTGGAALAVDSGRRLVHDETDWLWGALAFYEAVRLGRSEAAVEELHALPCRRDVPLVATQAAHAAGLAAADALGLEAAAETLCTLGARQYAAEAYAHAAAAHSRSGEPELAARAAVRSSVILTTCPGAVLSAPPEVTSPLTARQDAVARMAASGMTAREIAGELVNSVRTIQNHLRAVYGKLGLHGRHELMRLFDPEKPWVGTDH